MGQTKISEINDTLSSKNQLINFKVFFSVRLSINNGEDWLTSKPSKSDLRINIISIICAFSLLHYS